MDFVKYAWERRVVPCSPNSFYAYLRTISMGLRSLELAKDVELILRELQAAESALENALRDFDTLGNHLRNARNKWEEVEKEFRRVQAQLSALARKGGQ